MAHNISEKNTSGGKKRIEKATQYRWGADIIALVVIALLEFLYFREVFSGGRCFGTGEDGLLVNMMLEHWNDVIRNGTPFETLRVFYPQTGTLGYSDLLLGPGIIYTVYRSFGADIFLAYNSTVITLHVIGVVFMYLIVRKIGCSRIVGILGISLSLWSCSFSQLTWHVQFFSLTYIVMAAWGIIGMIRREDKSVRSGFPYLVWCSVSIGGAFLSSFYTAYLTVMFCSMTALIWIASAFIRREGMCRRLYSFFAKHWKEVILGGILQLPWMVILFAVYLPVFKELGSYEPGFALALSPVPIDFFRTLSYAPLETMIRSALPFRIDSGYEMWVENILMERSYGWSVPAAALWIASFVYTVRKKEKSGKDRMILSAIASILVLFLLSCRYGGFSPWIHLIARVLPGAGAIRATGRCLGILLIPMTFCICSKVMELEIDREGRKGKIRKYVICGEVIMICFLLLSSQCKRYILEDSDYYRQILAGCEQPPEDCKVFLLVSNNPDAVYSPGLQMVAWMIADEWDIWTINGYTGNYPKGWSLAYNNPEEYMINVQKWLGTNGIIDISNVYAYIPEENRWIKYEKIAQDERDFL